MAAPQTPVVPHWISGKTTLGQATGKQPVYNPSTGGVAAQVVLGTAADVDAAVAAARAAFASWSDTSSLRRSRVMFRFKALLEKASDELARLIAREHGKTISDAHGEIIRGLEVVEFACGAPHLLKGEFSENVGGGIDTYNVRQPLGVVAGITPFNFPAMVPMWMFPIALVCGNTFVFKPSERDPSASIRIAELLQEAGLPDGVFNVVQGDKTVVDALLAHPDIAAISFVGSTPVAKHIHLTGITNGKRVQALGGAKNHMIVMPDADLDLVTQAVLGAAYGSAGERCMAISIVVAVGDETADRLITHLAPKVKALRVGAADNESTEMGPLVTREHLNRVRDYVQIGIDEGAQLVVDGRDVRVAGFESGFYMGGCIFDGVTPQMRIYKEEIFGPVLAVVRVQSEAEAIEFINAHPFANGTAIFTSSGAAARTFTSLIKVGMVGVNVPLPVPMAFYSFGGWRNSLFGDHHIYGMEGVRFYTRLKCVTQRWPVQAPAKAEFTMPVMK